MSMPRDQPVVKRRPRPDKVHSKVNDHRYLYCSQRLVLQRISSSVNFAENKGDFYSPSRRSTSKDIIVGFRSLALTAAETTGREK